MESFTTSSRSSNSTSTTLRGRGGSERLFTHQGIPPHPPTGGKWDAARLSPSNPAYVWLKQAIKDGLIDPSAVEACHIYSNNRQLHRISPAKFPKFLRDIIIEIKEEPADPPVQDINMTFHVMNDYGIKRYFETWQDLAVNQTSLEVGYYNDYTFQIVIDQLKKGVTLPTYSFGNFLDLFTPRTVTVANDQIIYSCQLTNAFPTTMNAIQLNNDQDGIVELNVQLSYKNWKQI